MSDYLPSPDSFLRSIDGVIGDQSQLEYLSRQDDNFGEEVLALVGDFFPTRICERRRTRIPLLPFRLMHGDFGHEHWKNTVLVPYVESMIPNATEEEKNHYISRLKEILKKLREPMNAVARIYLEQKFLATAKRQEMRVYSRSEPVTKFDDITRSWQEDERDENLKRLWYVFYGQFEKMIGWETEVAELIKERCGVDFQESQEEIIQMRQGHGRGPPLKNGFEKLAVHMKGDMINQILDKGIAAHGRTLRIRAPRGHRMEENRRKGEFHQQFLEWSKVSDERKRYWDREAKKIGKPMLKEKWSSEKKPKARRNIDENIEQKPSPTKKGRSSSKRKAEESESGESVSTLDKIRGTRNPLLTVWISLLFEHREIHLRYVHFIN